MKHFINILVILILTGFAVGIAWWQYHTVRDRLVCLLYIPLFFLMIAWGNKLNEDYKDN